MVRSSIDPTTLIAGIREEVRSVDHNVPIADVQPLGEVVSQATAARRSTMLLLVGFAVIALALGVVGIYGVMSYAVNQQTHEIGIRMALGAQVKDVLRLVLQQGMALIVAGIVLGLLGAFSLSRLLTSLLFVVSPTDVLTFAGVALLLMAVALFACYIPSRRATKIDPMIALRYE
jgi:putative ABC transport system permease protein